jgi:hypothetical protein
MSERNTELFDRIADRIEERPDLHNQGVYGFGGGCDTPHCIAGWAVALSGGVVTGGADTDARALLKLNHREAGRLFSHRWKPHGGLTVPEALRAIGRGGAI